jgi:folliculin-interacting protein 2
VNELCYLVDHHDGRRRNYLLSSALTAVLATHLAWVATVAPDAAGDGGAVGMLQAQYPYNPLWAQLGDLYGAVTQPPTLARTVIVGRDAPVLRRFLYVLSYFVRSVRTPARWGGVRTLMRLSGGTQVQ